MIENLKPWLAYDPIIGKKNNWISYFFVTVTVMRVLLISLWSNSNIIVYLLVIVSSWHIWNKDLYIHLFFWTYKKKTPPYCNPFFNRMPIQQTTLKDVEITFKITPILESFLTFRPVVRERIYLTQHPPHKSSLVSPYVLRKNLFI